MSNARVAEQLASGEGERLRNAMQEQTLLIEAAIPAKAAADQKKAEAEAVLHAVDARMPTPPLSCPHCKGHILRNTRGAL